jgi:hypothetical protein
VGWSTDSVVLAGSAGETNISFAAFPVSHRD